MLSERVPRSTRYSLIESMMPHQSDWPSSLNSIIRLAPVALCHSS